MELNYKNFIVLRYINNTWSKRTNDFVAYLRRPLISLKKLSRIEQTTANETYDQPKTDLHKYIFIYECVFSYERLEYGKRSILWELFKDFTMNITHACNIVNDLPNSNVSIIIINSNIKSSPGYELHHNLWEAIRASQDLITWKPRSHPGDIFKFLIISCI